MAEQETGPILGGQDIEYHGGLHLRGSPLYFDAQEARELSFISSAAIPNANRHAKIIATSQTAELLKAIGAAHGRGRRAHEPQTLVTPYRRTFALGALSLELFPSGYVLGSASLLVQRAGRTLVYAGHINTRRHPLAERLEARRCDVLVLPCPPGPARLALPPVEDVERGIVEFVEASFDLRRVPVLLCPSLIAAPRVAHLLSTRGIALRLHRTIFAALRVYARAGAPVDLSRMRRYRGALDVVRRPEAVLWPLSLHDSPAIARLSRARTAVVSERALDPGFREGLRCDAAFALSAHADHASLLDYVRACQPSEVVFIGCQESALPDDLGALGMRIRRAGPQEQLALFEG